MMSSAPWRLPIRNAPVQYPPKRNASVTYIAPKVESKDGDIFDDDDDDDDDVFVALTNLMSARFAIKRLQ
jgi:hypothetical protein